MGTDKYKKAQGYLKTALIIIVLFLIFVLVIFFAFRNVIKALFAGG